MQKTGSLNEMHCTWQMLTRTSRAMGKARQKEVVELGISADALAVISAVVQLEQQAIPAEIARQLILEPHSVSQLLTRLEKDEIVRRERDLDFKNRVRIELTKHGKEIYRKSQKRRSIKKVMSVLTAEERDQLWYLLARLRGAALKYNGTKAKSLYPPDNRAELFEPVTQNPESSSTYEISLRPR